MKPYMWALLSTIIWGCAPILEKMGLAKVAVWPGLFYRCVGVMLGFALIVMFRFHEVKSAWQEPPSGWYYLIAGGFLASIIGQIFFYNALKGGEASRMIPLAATYPLVSFVLGIFLLKETITLAKVGGVVLVMAGVMLLK